VVCESEPTHAGPDRDGDSRGQSRLVHITSHWAFQLVNDSLAFSRADSFCRGQFSSLATLDKPEDRDGALELLRQTGLHSPIWVRNPSKASSKPVALSKQYVQFSALNFPKESSEGFARVNMSFPALSSVSVCVRVQWNPEWNEVSTIFSYAAPVFTNEFQLRGQVDMQGRILLALIIHGKHLPYKASFPNDGAWHHVCVTWHRNRSHWAIYVDGDMKDMGSGTDNSRDIYGDGILILGQDQDSFGGNFTEPFFGNITDLNVWNISLEKWHVRALNACSAITPEVLFSWKLDHLSRPPSGERGAGPSALPSSSRERYLKIKQMSDSQNSQPTAFMNHLMELSNQTQVVLGQQPSGLSSLAQASALLDVSFQALEDTQQEGLQPTDMVSLIQLLSLAAEVPTQPLVDATNHSQDNIQELSQNFISVADSIISEDNALKWQAIKEVVNGPMDVVKSIDRMVTGLSPRLMAETDRLTIHSPNIKLEVQQHRLQEGSKGSTFCGPETEKRTNLDCISVPHQKIQDLHNNGFNKLTLVNTWYGSLRPLFNPEENITMVPTVTDGSQRYLGTVLGSSVISTTVLGDDQPVSTAVRFQLQHRVQNPAGTVYDPVCAFWDFDLTPEAGGWWNTKGCEVVSKQYGYTTCYCNHTTNFALLLQVYEAQVNAVVLCRVVMVTVSSARRRAKMLSPSSASKMQAFDLTWAVTRPVLILLPVLGLTWLCGVLVHLSVVVAYIFIALNAFQGLYIFFVYAVYNSEVRNAIKRIKEKRKALSFTNCSQPTSFLPSQRAPITSWGRSPPTPSSPETSETSGPTSSTSTSLVIKNGHCIWRDFIVPCKDSIYMARLMFVN
ncbi:Adhesion G-protein coupled receptor D2, partial [Larimichthys crocea]